MEIKNNPMWPTMFYVADWPEAATYRKQLVDLCYQLRERDEEWDLARRAKMGLFESPPDLFSHPQAEPLMQFCGAVVATIFQRDVLFPETWCHITNGGGYHDAHAHADFVRGACGIYYLQSAECTVDPPNGLNRFYSPSVFEPNDVADFQPVDGRLIIFQGNVRHAALPYTGKDDRIVISFNAAFGIPGAGNGNDQVAPEQPESLIIRP